MYYYNCCGAEFTSESKEVVCLNCGCEYNEDDGYIERYTIVENN